MIAISYIIRTYSSFKITEFVFLNKYTVIRYTLRPCFQYICDFPRINFAKFNVTYRKKYHYIASVSLSTWEKRK